MGHNNLSKQLLTSVHSGIYKESAKLMVEYINEQEKYNQVKRVKDRIYRTSAMPRLLSSLEESCTKIILKKKYYDESQLSRTYFMDHNSKRPDEARFVKSLDAVFLYILRSHCAFWIITPICSNNLSASKVALNDLVQAELLVKDMMLNLRFTEAGDYDERLENSVAFSKNDHKMTYKALFIALQFIVAMFKGNVHKNINFSENALDDYFEALRLYERHVEIRELENPFNLFLCPSVANLYLEASKLLFDKGRIIDALVYHMHSLTHIIVLSYQENNGDKENIEKVFNNLHKASKFLKNLRFLCKDSIRKDVILNMFIDSSKTAKIYEYINKIDINSKIVPLNKNFPTISPELLHTIKSSIYSPLKLTVSELLTRLGFILYTIRESIQADRYPANLTKPDEFKNEVTELNKLILQEIKEFFKGYDGFESEVGNYTLALIWREGTEFHSKRVERVFNFHALLGYEKEQENALSILCSQLARHSLINTQNLSSIPMRVTNFLGQDGYKKRTSQENNFHRGSINKLVILRRWQSFNPKVPRPKGQDIRGGGYFLFWEHKGIVIDPGYNFIQNFYEEGFSVEDIDAIVITHTHPDHDEELNTILMLINEWNQLNKKQEGKTIDLFLNEGAYRKYSTWIYSEKIMIGKIYMLQSSRWEKKSKTSSSEASRKDANPMLDLFATYKLKLEIVPSWHDELIDKHASVGLLFHLYATNKQDASLFSIGFTGDTEYYPGIDDNYNKADILVAHLGDIKLREIMSYSNNPDQRMETFAKTWLTSISKINKNALKTLADYLIYQDLYGLDLADLRDGIDKTEKDQQIKKLLGFEDKDLNSSSINKIKKNIGDYSIPGSSYVYKNHLGIRGIYELHSSISNQSSPSSQRKLMIIGELPEELQSYRHILACLLSSQEGSNVANCLTGDIGLTIGLPTDGITFGHPEHGCESQFAVRCARCNQNNEYIKGLKNNGVTYLPHYYAPDHIQEIPLKALNSRIVWLCNKQHGGKPEYCKHEYFIAPDLRSLWS